MHLSLFFILILSILLYEAQPEPGEEICEDEPPSKRIRKACYFSIPRKTSLENKPRDDKFKVSTSCEGTMHPMIDLAQNHGGVLFGAPHELALVLCEGEGVFLDGSSNLSRWEDEGICDKHLAELSRNFKATSNPRVSYQRDEGGKCVKCAYPEPGHVAHQSRTMSYQKSRNLLLAEGLLVPPGTGSYSISAHYTVHSLAESFKEFEQASVHPKPMGWALRSTKKGVKYNPKAKQLVTDLFEDYFKHAKKLRAEEAEKRMKERTDILPADRMSHEQIKNLIRSLIAAKKKEMENSGIKSRRRRALLDDMAMDLEEEGGVIEEEVEVDEADREITADAIYDLVLSDLAEFFNDPTNVEESDPMIGNIDE